MPIYIYIYIYNHVGLLKQISLTLSLHSSLSSMASDKASKLHLLSVQSYFRQILVGCPTLHRRTSLMSLSLLLQQCPACLVHLIWMFLEMTGWWPYTCCFVGCCFHILFSISHSIFVQFPFGFFSICYSAPMWCIYIVELTRLLLGKNCV